MAEQCEENLQSFCSECLHRHSFDECGFALVLLLQMLSYKLLLPKLRMKRNRNSVITLQGMKHN